MDKFPREEEGLRHPKVGGLESRDEFLTFVGLRFNNERFFLYILLELFERSQHFKRELGPLLSDVMVLPLQYTCCS